VGEAFFAPPYQEVTFVYYLQIRLINFSKDIFLSIQNVDFDLKRKFTA